MEKTSVWKWDGRKYTEEGYKQSNNVAGWKAIIITNSTKQQPQNSSTHNSVYKYGYIILVNFFI